MTTNEDHDNKEMKQIILQSIKQVLMERGGA